LWPPFDKVKCNFCGSEQYEERRIEYLYSYKGKYLYVDLATRLDDLRVPPGNRLHALKGDRKGQYSIAINDQWRICFRFVDGDAYDVEICDYH